MSPSALSKCGAAAAPPQRDPRLVYQAFVRSCFFGRLLPPFAMEMRERAGLTLDWFGPLVEKEARDAIPGELSASDMG